MERSKKKEGDELPGRLNYRCAELTRPVADAHAGGETLADAVICAIRSADIWHDIYSAVGEV